MEVQGKQNSTVTPGNSQQHCQAAKGAFSRWVSRPKQPVDTAIDSSRQPGRDDRQRQSGCQGRVHAADVVATRFAAPLATGDPVNPDKQCYSMLRDELIAKNLAMRFEYAQHSSQRQDHEDIPGNFFFEWLGKARISEKNLINIQHFRALARFNSINVKVLVDKPITIAATEARIETVTGRIETITVARLYEDFRAALKEADSPEAGRIYDEFVRRTEQHRVGLCNHALRSDYFRFALMYTYGGVHSDVAVSMQDFDRSRGAVEMPLIPLKGKNGFLVRIHNEAYPLLNATVKSFICMSSSLMASSRHNQMVLSMLASMLGEEDRLESENMCITNTGMITDKKYTTNDRDMMRLYQCRKDQVIRFMTNRRLEEDREYFHEMALVSNASEEEIREAFKISYSSGFAKALDEGYGPERTRVKCASAVTGITRAGMDYLYDSCCGINKPYQERTSIITGSGFPFPKNAPSIANMKPLHLEGDNSWFKGLSNPDYIDDIDCWSPENITSQQE